MYSRWSCLFAFLGKVQCTCPQITSTVTWWWLQSGWWPVPLNLFHTDDGKRTAGLNSERKDGRGRGHLMARKGWLGDTCYQDWSRLVQHAIRYNDTHEQAMRADAMADKLIRSNVIAFWKEGRALNKTSSSIPCVIEGVSGPDNPAEMWRQHSSALCNSVESDANIVGSESLTLFFTCDSWAALAASHLKVSAEFETTTISTGEKHSLGTWTRLSMQTIFLNADNRVISVQFSSLIENGLKSFISWVAVWLLQR